MVINKKITSFWLFVEAERPEHRDAPSSIPARAGFPLQPASSKIFGTIKTNKRINNEKYNQ
jgi:hypothetical protein